MRRKRYYIIPQYFPTCTGERPLSFAVYCGKTFLCYSWSLARAWVALQHGRRALGFELKESYFKQAVANLRNAQGGTQEGLFAMASTAAGTGD